MPNAIITGAKGFVGRRLCATLQSNGWTVTGCGRAKQAGPWDDFIEWDVSERLSNTTSRIKPADVFFHLASKAHALSEIGEDEAEYRRINIDGAQHALEIAEQTGARRLVYFSSVKAMGEGNSDYESAAPIDETFDCLPTSPYGASKLEAERLVLSSDNRLESVVIRPCLVYGPDSKGNLTKMAEAIRKKRFPPIPEFGNRRSVVHVDDLCQLALSAATNPKASGEIFIAAEPQAYSTREMYELMLSAMNEERPSWSIPTFALKAMGCAGDLIGKLRGKRFVFDSDALSKLSESAHYDGSKATKLLDFNYKHALGPSLIDIFKSG